MKWAARKGQVLAFLAALVLAVNPYLLHAQSSGEGGHNHFGSVCSEIDSENSSSDEDGGATSPHDDCIHFMEPFPWVPIEHGAPYVSVATVPPLVEQLQQHTPSFDPPPPRYPS
jgi:hypothetical protein